MRRSDFLRGTRQGRRVVTRFFIVFISDRDDTEPTRLGITVTRKVGNAVRRNRIKRVVREWFRQRRYELGARDLIVIAKRSIPSSLKLIEVQTDLDRVLRKPPMNGSRDRTSDKLS
ncbi:MAG: ribonuclease P protein component [bacterium]|nr:ribonuclease P protein component [bacterium]